MEQHQIIDQPENRGPDPSEAVRVALAQEALGKSNPSSGTDTVSNPLTALANGFLMSGERAVNGAIQLNNGEARTINVAKQADPDSLLAQGAFMAGDLVGTGLQLMMLRRAMPAARSLVGTISMNAGVGAVYGGLFQPSEGANLPNERFTNAVSMGAFMSAYEVARVGAFGAGLIKPTIAHGLMRGSIAGGAGGAVHEVVNSSLSDRGLSLTAIGVSTAKGAIMGIGSELGATALIRTDNRHLISAHPIERIPAPVRTAPKSEPAKTITEVNASGLAGVGRGAGRDLPIVPPDKFVSRQPPEPVGKILHTADVARGAGKDVPKSPPENIRIPVPSLPGVVWVAGKGSSILPPGKGI